MQRNNITQKFPRRAKVELVRWREIDGLTPIEIRTQADEKWPELPTIHSRTWQAWSQGREYRELRTIVVDEKKKNEKLETLWASVEAGGLGNMMQGTMYLLLQRAFETAGDQDLETKELSELVRSISTAQRSELARLQEDRKQEIEQLEQEHAAEMAEMKADNAEMQAELDEQAAEIARLTAILDQAGLNNSGRSADGQVSPATMARIKKLYGIT